MECPTAMLSNQRLLPNHKMFVQNNCKNALKKYTIISYSKSNDLHKDAKSKI